MENVLQLELLYIVWYKAIHSQSGSYGYLRKGLKLLMISVFPVFFKYLNVPIFCKKPIASNIVCWICRVCIWLIIQRGFQIVSIWDLWHNGPTLYPFSDVNSVVARRFRLQAPFVTSQSYPCNICLCDSLLNQQRINGRHKQNSTSFNLSSETSYMCTDECDEW